MSASIRRLRLSAPRSGLTLIEMLVATAITLLMMAAVVNLFANLTGSISNRRAVIELSGQLRQARQRLSLDLAGATCPAVPWQRPGDDVGYLEIIEGGWSDQNSSALVDADPKNGELDYAASILPRNNLVGDYDNSGDVDDDDASVHASNINSLTPGGLGDYDDVLALTVRSDDEPFVAQVGGNRVESRLAEVVWFAIENPANGLLGEPGMRSIYRRVFVIAPSRPNVQGPPDPQWYFQRYDISAHYDPTLDFNGDGNADGGWVPNTLSDLTRRENRCYRQSGKGADPISPFPHMMVSGGAGYTGNSVNVAINRSGNDQKSGDASATAFAQDGSVVSYAVTDNGVYDDLPTLRVQGPGLEATARPIMAQVAKMPNPAWRLAQITFGPAPLSIHRVGTGPGDIVDRTGEDLMLSDALAFDLRVYDPGAPVYQRSISAGGAAVLVQPGDPGFAVTNSPASYGAYIDMGWSPLYPDQLDKTLLSVAPQMPKPIFDIPHQPGWHPRLDLPTANVLAYPYGWPAEYDTWSLHYESDGIDQDGDGRIDQGTNGLDDDIPVNSGIALNGPDDVAERETSPPYDAPLRGVQVRLRVYERDARQIRETSVTRNLVP